MARDYVFGAPQESPDYRRAAAARQLARLNLGGEAKADAPDAPAVAPPRIFTWEPVAKDVLVVEGSARAVSISRHRQHQRLERLDFADEEGARRTMWFVDGERFVAFDAALEEVEAREKATGQYVLQSPLLKSIG